MISNKLTKLLLLLMTLFIVAGCNVSVGDDDDSGIENPNPDDDDDDIIDLCESADCVGLETCNPANGACECPFDNMNDDCNTCKDGFVNTSGNESSSDTGTYTCEPRRVFDDSLFTAAIPVGPEDSGVLESELWRITYDAGSVDREVWLVILDVIMANAKLPDLPATGGTPLNQLYGANILVLEKGREYLDDNMSFNEIPLQKQVKLTLLKEYGTIIHEVEEGGELEIMDTELTPEGSEADIQDCSRFFPYDHEPVVGTTAMLVNDDTVEIEVDVSDEGNDTFISTKSISFDGISAPQKIGIGLYRATLTPGSYDVTVTVEDQNNSVGQDNLQIEIQDPCQGIDCNSNGTCSEGVCGCFEGFTGTNCELCEDGYTGYPDCHIPLGTIEVSTNNALGGFTVYDANSVLMGSSSPLDLSPGDYTIRFDDVPGYFTPTDIVATVFDGALGTYTGTYTEDLCYETDCGNGSCNPSDGSCDCDDGYDGTSCDTCAVGYFDYPNCIVDQCYGVSCDDGLTCNGVEGCNSYTGCTSGVPVDCGSYGDCTEPSGVCQCDEGYDGPNCDTCDTNYAGYPSCAPWLVSLTLYPTAVTLMPDTATSVTLSSCNSLSECSDILCPQANWTVTGEVGTFDDINVFTAATTDTAYGQAWCSIDGVYSNECDVEVTAPWPTITGLAIDCSVHGGWCFAGYEYPVNWSFTNASQFSSQRELLSGSITLGTLNPENGSLSETSKTVNYTLGTGTVPATIRLTITVIDIYGREASEYIDIDIW